MKYYKDFFFRKIKVKRSRFFNIGPYKILLPKNHLLDYYQTKYKRTNVQIGEITRIAKMKYPELTAIDIGANIGDTAALFCKYSKVPVLCIEGDDYFINILKKNIARITCEIEIENCFLGSAEISINPNQLSTISGTTSAANAISRNSTDENLIRTKSLQSILKKHKKFLKSKIIKIDTDGMDFIIIIESIKVFESMKSILFFEYDPGLAANGEKLSHEAINALIKIGYNNFLIYDNFGNYLISVNSSKKFFELNAYLRSNKKYGVAVGYFDVCAFHKKDNDLFRKIRSYEINQ